MAFTILKPVPGTATTPKPSGLVPESPITTTTAPVATPTDVTPTSDSGFVGNISNDFAERRKTLEETNKAYQSGKQGLVSTVLQHVGQIAGGVGDIVGEGIKSVAKSLPGTSEAYQAARKSLESDTNNPLNKVDTAILHSDFAKNAVEAMKAGKDSYDALREKYPTEVKNFEAAINILSILPIEWGAKAGIKAAAPIVESAIQEGKTVVQTAKTAVSKAVTSSGPSDAELLNKIAPKLTPKETAEALNAGHATQAVSPKLGVVSPTDLSNYPGVKENLKNVREFLTGKTATEDLNSIKKGVVSESEGIRNWGKTNEVPFNHEDLINNIKQVEPRTDLLNAGKDAYSSYERAKKVGTDTFAKAMRASQKAVDAVTGKVNPAEMWDAAIKVDQKIKAELKDAIFDSPQYKGIKAAAMSTRNAIREYIVNAIKYPGQMEKFNKFKEFVNTAKQKGIDMGPEGEALLLEKFGIRSTPESEAAAKYWMEKMDKLHSMLDVSTNLSEKAVSEASTNPVGRFLKTPKGKVVKNVLKGTAVIGGLGAAGSGANAIVKTLSE